MGSRRPVRRTRSWDYTITDGPWFTKAECEAKREARLDNDRTLCVKLK